MRKIPTMFLRDWDGDRSRVLNAPNPDCAWVFAGEGVGTRKYDGMSVMFDGENWFKRREVKFMTAEINGLPEGFVEVDRDLETSKVVGWVPIGAGPEDKYMRAAIEQGGCLEPTSGEVFAFKPGTYEFVGEKSQGNAENIVGHWMIAHADAHVIRHAPRDFDGLRDFFAHTPFEGLVFHHPDGRMAKIKAKDFGFKRAAHVVIDAADNAALYAHLKTPDVAPAVAV